MEPEGIEPSFPPCKGRVLPIELQPHRASQELHLVGQPCVLMVNKHSRFPSVCPAARRLTSVLACYTQYTLYGRLCPHRCSSSFLYRIIPQKRNYPCMNRTGLVSCSPVPNPAYVSLFACSPAIPTATLTLHLTKATSPSQGYFTNPPRITATIKQSPAISTKPINACTCHAGKVIICR